METQAACISAGETLRQAGHRMRELGVTTLRVRGEDGRLRGIVSRDMIVRGIAAGADPKFLTVGELSPAGQPEPPAVAGDRRAAAYLATAGQAQWAPKARVASLMALR